MIFKSTLLNGTYIALTWSISSNSSIDWIVNAVIGQGENI